MGHHRIQNIHNGKVSSGTVKAGGEDKKAPGTYIKWDAPGVETVQPSEKEKIQEVGRLCGASRNWGGACGVRTCGVK